MIIKVDHKQQPLLHFTSSQLSFGGIHVDESFTFIIQSKIMTTFDWQVTLKLPRKHLVKY